MRDFALTLRACADFTEASCELTSMLPASETRLHVLLKGHLIISRTALRMAALKPISEEDERLHRLLFRKNHDSR